jgi:hypothetical protein
MHVHFDRAVSGHMLMQMRARQPSINPMFKFSTFQSILRRSMFAYETQAVERPTWTFGGDCLSSRLSSRNLIPQILGSAASGQSTLASHPLPGSEWCCCHTPGPSQLMLDPEMVAKSRIVRRGLKARPGAP